MAEPQSMLPQEAWDLIFNCLKHPQDILSCLRTCTMFQGCLSSTRTTWAFPSVFPFLIEFLPRNDVLNCRFVSKSWRSVVDNFIQSDHFAPTIVKLLRNYDKFSNNLLTRIPKYKILNIANLHHEMHMDGRWAMDLNRDWIPENPNQFQQFVSVFDDNSEKNPFPSRSVVLIITETDIQHLFQFLDIFGAQIASLGIVVRFTSLDMYEIVQLFWKMLNRVPNLKYLLIDQAPDHINVFRFDEDDNGNDMLLISRTPELKKLIWIELKISCMNTHDIFVDAFGSRPVTIFGLVGGINTSHISENDWKHLDVELRAGVSTMIWNFHMKSFKHLHLPLESINLRYFQCVDLKSIFENLSKYGTTLRQVTVTFNMLTNEEFVQMRKQVDAIYTRFLSQMKCLDSFNMVVHCDKATAEFRQFIDKTLDANWIDKYLEMGGVIRGCRKGGFAIISAGMQTTGERSSALKRKYCTYGKNYRSMWIVEKKLNLFKRLFLKMNFNYNNFLPCFQLYEIVLRI